MTNMIHCENVHVVAVGHIEIYAPFPKPAKSVLIVDRTAFINLPDEKIYVIPVSSKEECPCGMLATYRCTVCGSHLCETCGANHHVLNLEEL